MKQFPKLETERLLLNQTKPTDIPDIIMYAGNKNITDNTRTMPHPYFEEDAIRWLNSMNQGFKNKEEYTFAMRQKKDAHFIGGIGLTIDVSNNRAELGYWLAEPFWNQGFTTEAVQAIFKFAFEVLNLNKIVAVYLSTNQASGKVMLKNGMTKEGEFIAHDVKKDHTVADGKYISLIQYRMLKSEYLVLKTKS